MANGTRNNAIIGQDIDLEYQFTLNSQPFDAFTVNKVEIYGSLSDAQNGVNILQTIASTDITHIQAETGQPPVYGRYRYTAQGRNVAQVYFDKIFITPKNGYDEFTDIEQFYVREEEFGGGPSELPKKCLVYGWIDEPAEGTYIRAQLNQTGLYNNEVVILSNARFAKTDSNGYWSLSLPVTSLLETGAYWEFEISGRKIRKTIPEETATANILQLPNL